MPGQLLIASKSVAANNTPVFPTETTQMRSFLDTCNAFRRFIKCFVTIAPPLDDYQRKNKKFDWLDTKTETLDAFNNSKFELVEPSVVSIP